MDNNEICNITKKDFRKLCTLSEAIYNSLVVVDYSCLSALNGHAVVKLLTLALCRQAAFCKNQKEIEELNNLAPVIKNLRNDADILYTFFIDY